MHYAIHHTQHYQSYNSYTICTTHRTHATLVHVVCVGWGWFTIPGYHNNMVHIWVHTAKEHELTTEMMAELWSALLMTASDILLVP